MGSKTEWISIICNLMKEKPEPELWDLRREAFGKLRTSLWVFIVSLYRSLSMQSHHHLHSVGPTLLLRTSSTKETMDLFLSLWSLPRSCYIFLSFSLTARQGNAVAGWRNRPIDKLVYGIENNSIIHSCLFVCFWNQFLKGHAHLPGIIWCSLDW